MGGIIYLSVTNVTSIKVLLFMLKSRENKTLCKENLGKMKELCCKSKVIATNHKLHYSLNVQIYIPFLSCLQMIFKNYLKFMNTSMSRI